MMRIWEFVEEYVPTAARIVEFDHRLVDEPEKRLAGLGALVLTIREEGAFELQKIDLAAQKVTWYHPFRRRYVVTNRLGSIVDTWAARGDCKDD